MPRLVVHGAALWLALALISPGCKKKGAKKPAGMESVIAMNDPAAAPQLESGFYGVEGGGYWRWTGRVFAVKLMPPAGADTKGAKLHFHFTIPDALFNKVGAIELSAAVNTPGVVGLTLEPEHYTSAGTYDYARDIDAGAFERKGPIRIEFTCDKSMTPGGDDKRELSLIASSISLEPR